MDVYDGQVRYAYRIVDTDVRISMEADKDDQDVFMQLGILTLLDGIDPAFLMAPNGPGHNYQAAMDAIHDYYRVNKVEIIPPNFFSALCLIADASESFKIVQKTFNFISYQLYKDKEVSATFHVDSAAVLDLWSKTISENHEKLTAEMPNFDSWLREKCDYLRNTYGIRWDSRGF